MHQIFTFQCTLSPTVKNNQAFELSHNKDYPVNL